MDVPVSLIERNPDALEFVRKSSEDINGLRCFPREEFAKIVTGVYSSTSVDLQGEAFDLEALHHFVDVVRTTPFYLRKEHDPAIHPIGRMLTAKVFYDEASNIHFIAGLTGLYDSSRLPRFADVGIDISRLLADETAPKFSGVYGTDLRGTIEFNPHEIERSLVREILRDAPSWVSRTPELQFRKSADPIAILCISLSISALSYNPFLKKFQERLGEKAADGSLQLLNWIASTVASKFCTLRKPTRLLIESIHEECELGFVISSKDPSDIHGATELLGAARDSAIRLHSLLRELGPTKIMFEYDVKSHVWLPLDVITAKEGVITDQPYLMVIERLQGGFSLGGKLTAATQIE